MNRTVCITGLGIESAFAKNIAELWQKWNENSSLFSLIQNNFREQSFFAVSQIEVLNFSELYDRKIQKLTTKKDLIALLAIQRSAMDAGLKKGEYDPHRLGIFVGAASTQVCDLFSYGELLQRSLDPESEFIDLKKFGSGLLSSVNPMVMMQNLMNNVLCYASIQWDARGMNRCFLDYQSAGLNAVCSAFDAIRFGYCDMAFAGGASGLADIITLEEGFRSGFIKSIQDESSFSPHPFIENPRGTCLSEMAAYLFLESEESALRRGATIYGKIISYKSMHDGVCNFNSEGDAYSYASKCLNEVLKSGDKSICDVGLYLSSANEISFIDQSESMILNELPLECAVAIPKARFGESSEASGVLSLLLGIQALKAGFIPKSLNASDYFEKTILSEIDRYFEPQPLDNRRLLCVASKSYSRLNQNILVEVV